MECQRTENSWHLDRNCRYFDKPKVAYRWEPEYQTQGGTFFQIAEVECDECPISFITAESKLFMEMRGRLRNAKEIGVQLIHPGEIPAKTMDALMVLQSEDYKFDTAYAKAQELEGPNRSQDTFGG